jgi:hypothetical protein
MSVHTCTQAAAVQTRILARTQDVLTHMRTHDIAFATSLHASYRDLAMPRAQSPRGVGASRGTLPRGCQQWVIHTLKQLSQLPQRLSRSPRFCLHFFAVRDGVVLRTAADPPRRVARESKRG